MFGYKIHPTSTTTGDIVVPLTASDVTITANVQYYQMYVPLTSTSFSAFSLPSLYYIVADPGYDDKKLYRYSKSIGNRFGLFSVERYKNTSKERLELVYFYEFVLGQFTYNQRRISIELLIEHIKLVFRIDPLSVYGFQSVSAIVLWSVLLYQIMVYYNCKTKRSNPKSIRYAWDWLLTWKSG
jgi:hypothetical protein